MPHAHGRVPDAFTTRLGMHVDGGPCVAKARLRHLAGCRQEMSTGAPRSRLVQRRMF